MSVTDPNDDIALPGPAEYARDCVEHLVRRRKPPAAPGHPLYGLRAACFVSLKKRGELRGCVGTLAPTEPDLGREIARNARAASFNDPRFDPVRDDELDALEVSVDILSPSEACSYSELDPVRYGVIVRSGWRRGVLLPDLKGVDTVDLQVRIARQKAGIPPGEPCEYERFCVTRCHEGESADAVLAAMGNPSPGLAICDGEVDG
jgi:AmmeMemoRadiSam system protein A